MIDVTEADIEAYLVRRVKETGGEVRKVKWIGRKSAPDRFVMRADQWAYLRTLSGYRGNQRLRSKLSVWAEVKPPGGKATFPKNAHERAQHREHERMRAMGQHVVVVDSFEGVEELLKLVSDVAETRPTVLTAQVTVDLPMARCAHIPIPQCVRMELETMLSEQATTEEQRAAMGAASTMRVTVEFY